MWAVSQKRIMITWGNFASIMFHFKRQQAFLLCNLAYNLLGLITDKMYMNILQHEYESSYHSGRSPASIAGRILCGHWSPVHWRGLFSLSLQFFFVRVTISDNIKIP